ncbi:MAG: asparagine synthase (glutamine-hydrolyzing) [Candidatus Dormibacterales bacterium]
MCGIAGYISDKPFDDGVLDAMTRALRHRGPDAEGFLRRSPAHLGHRRLSIIDVAGSAQPIFNEDRSLAIIFNGEIYNYQALRRALLEAGHRFCTRGDTEVLVHAYEQYGTRMLEKLHGMFAFAIWDAKRRSLFLARDQVGVKPLYYYWDGSLFAFGSELKSILAHPSMKREIDLEAVNLFLECQYIPAPRTIYTRVRKLPPAHGLLLEGGKLREFGYWMPDYSEKIDCSEAEAVALVESELRKSVESMLMSEVPLGAFVSGGVDSGLVAALMTDCLRNPVETFNLGFEGDTLQSEHEEAAVVARHIGSNHHALMIEPRTVLSGMDRWVEIFDEPFGDQAALPTMLLSEFARRHVTVVLTGEGADEVFSGYNNYGKRARDERITRILGAPWSPLRAVIPLLPAVLRKDRLIKAASRPVAERYVTIPNIFDEAVRPSLYSDAFRRATRERLATYAARFFDECNSADYLDRIMYVDTRLWLPDDLLTKVDRSTMAHSLEARVPYLDHGFIGACARLKPQLKQLKAGWTPTGKTEKYVLKKLAEKYLPREIVHRDKQGFVMPLRQWLDGGLKPLVEESLGPSGLAKRNVLRLEALERLKADHFSGRKDHSMRIWVLLILELWLKRYDPAFSL